MDIYQSERNLHYPGQAKDSQSQCQLLQRNLNFNMYDCDDFRSIKEKILEKLDEIKDRIQTRIQNSIQPDVERYVGVELTVHLEKKVLFAFSNVLIPSL